MISPNFSLIYKDDAEILSFLSPKIASSPPANRRVDPRPVPDGTGRAMTT